MSVDSIRSHVVNAYDSSYYSYPAQTNGGCPGNQFYVTGLAIIFVCGLLLVACNSMNLEGRQVAVQANENQNND